jgi:pectinesterase
MKKETLIAILASVLIATLTFAQVEPSDLRSKSWSFVATKMPAEWYGSAEAKSVAENVLMAQKEIGGWGEKQTLSSPIYRNGKIPLP